MGNIKRKRNRERNRSHMWSMWLVVGVQPLSHFQLFVTSWTVSCQAPPSSTVSWSLFKFMPMESVMLSNHFILCCPFPFHLQSFPASGSFLMSQFFASGGQSIGASASASVLPTNVQDWFLSGLTGLISSLSTGLSRVFNTPIGKHQFFNSQASLWSNFHIASN